MDGGRVLAARERKGRTGKRGRAAPLDRWRPEALTYVDVGHLGLGLAVGNDGGRGGLRWLTPRSEGDVRDSDGPQGHPHRLGLRGIPQEQLEVELPAVGTDLA